MDKTLISVAKRMFPGMTPVVRLLDSLFRHRHAELHRVVVMPGYVFTPFMHFETISQVGSLFSIMMNMAAIIICSIVESGVR
jgi:hypothetical protein